MANEALGRVAYEVFQRTLGVYAPWAHVPSLHRNAWNAAVDVVLAKAQKQARADVASVPALAPATAPKPSIGRIVHYTEKRTDNAPNQVYAAIIVDVYDDETVHLTVFNKDGETVPHCYVVVTDAPAGSQEAVGKWAWPART